MTLCTRCIGGVYVRGVCVLCGHDPEQAVERLLSLALIAGQADANTRRRRREWELAADKGAG